MIRLRRPFLPKQYQSRDAACRFLHFFVMTSHPNNGATERPLLSVVDDDEMLRESLPDLLREFGFAGSSFFVWARVSLV
jgi:hypothetical protein